MSTKLRGDIAEQAAIFHAMEHGLGVMRPVGDRLPYDVVFDVQGRLLKIQVKMTWYCERSKSYQASVKRTKTNRRRIKVSRYSESDFDFAMLYLRPLDLFYIIPVADFVRYGSLISIVEGDKRQRKPRSATFRDAWHLITG